MKNKFAVFVLCFFILMSLVLSACGKEIVLSDNVSEDTAGLTVSYIDVGQGDATLIECGDKAMLIDAGIYGERYKVTSYISQRGIKSLDYCVATHPHSDHIGGMPDVITSFDVDTLVYPLCESDSDSWNYVLDAADERGVSYFNPQPGDTFYLDEARLTVLSPYKNDIYSDLNDYSMVLKLEYGDVSFMFMGDAEAVVEQNILADNFDVSADVLKCGHHGSSTSTSKTFLKAVNPAAAVISCGKDNDYGHPHQETLDELGKNDIQIFRTDESSTIVARSDGKTISFMSADTQLGSIAADTGTYTPETLAEETVLYVGNKNSKVYHLPDCGSVENMKDKNKVYLESEKDATDKGYEPCGSCKP